MKGEKYNKMRTHDDNNRANIIQVRNKNKKTTTIKHNNY